MCSKHHVVTAKGRESVLTVKVKVAQNAAPKTLFQASIREVRWANAQPAEVLVSKNNYQCQSLV